MTVPFLAGADGNPIQLHSAIVGQPTKGVPPISTAAWRDFRDYGGGPALSQTRYDALAFSPSGEPLTPLTGKLAYAAGANSLGDLDPADYGVLHMFANLFGGRRTITVPSGTIQQWQFDQNQTVDPNLVWLAIMRYTNVLPGEIAFDGRVGGVTINAQPNSNISIGFNRGAGQFLLAEDGEYETVVGTPTIPLVRGIWPGQMLNVDDADLWFKLVSDDTGGAYTFQAALGSSTVEPTWSGSQSTTTGKWVRVIDSVTGQYIGGSLGAAIQVFLPVGATLEAGMVVRIPRNRVNWAETLGASRAIASIDSLFIVDGEEIRVTGGYEINSAWETFEVVPDVSGLQGHFVDRRGTLNTVVTPTRRIEDLTIQSALLRRANVSLVVRAETASLIPSNDEPYQAVFLFPSLSIAGGVYGPGEGADTAEEAPTLTAGVPSATFNYTDERGNTFSTDAAFSAVLRNDKAAV
jgi:hypothetical protein